MSEEKKYTIQEANQFFAIEHNNNIWSLLSKKEKTEDDNNEIINLAHSSLLHWSKSPKCKIVNLQRGEYMISIAYTNANRAESALYHAKKCMKITEENREEMEDFDIAYAFLGMAKALNLSENEIISRKEEADKYLEEAKKLGEKIKDEEDKNIFMGDLEEG
ncbi:MAG: hypothetical protein AABZ74_09625 [Cyanobacteriota bacterium]